MPRQDAFVYRLVDGRSGVPVIASPPALQVVAGIHVPSSVGIASGWPDASNTGPRAGHTLTNQGSITYSTPGQVITDKNFTGGVTVTANNVTFRDCKFNAYATNILMLNTGYSLTGTLAEYCEFDGGNVLPGGSGQDTRSMGFSGYTIRRCNIYGVVSGVHMNDDVLVEENWIHDLYQGPGSHNDGVLCNGGSNLTIRGNNIEFGLTQTACISIFGDFAPMTNVLVENNLFNGGGYTIYGGSTSSKPFPNATQIRFLNNVFGRKYYAECGFWGSNIDFNSGGSGNVWSGNTWGGGAAATGAHSIGDPVLVG